MKFVCLLSSGIDSPVACFLMSKFGDIVTVHIDNRPFTDDREIDNFHTLQQHLKVIIAGNIVKSYIVNHGEALSEITHTCRRNLTCVICKRMMLRYAESIAKKEKADAIVMGDSLGQVASQTLRNIRVEQQAIHFPVLQPLIGFDKQEIVDMARDVGTYDFSILSSQSCSAVPIKPSTQAKLSDVLSEEKKLNIDKLVQKAIRNAELFSS